VTTTKITKTTKGSDVITKHFVFFNLDAAKQIGLTISPNV
jgi:hypothetical protein